MELKNKRYLYLFLSIVGLVLVLVTSLELGTFTQTLKAFIFGSGAILLGIGLTQFVQVYYFEKNPVYAKVSGEQKDERLLLLRYKAKHKATLVTNALILLLAYGCLLDELPIWLVFSLIGIYCLNNVLSIIFHAKLKE